MSTPNPPPSGQPDPTRSWLTTPQPPSSTPSPPTPPTDGAAQPSPPPAKSHAQPTITDAVTSIKPSDFLSVHRTPCAQTGFLTGFYAGSGMAVVQWMMGRSLPRVANWAVGAGAVAAMAQYEYCQAKRRQEREKMVRMVEVYNTKQAAEKAEAERRKQEVEEKAKVPGGEAEGGKGWRFW